MTRKTVCLTLALSFLSASAFAENIIVADMTQYFSAAGALRVHVGNRIELPPLAECGTLAFGGTAYVYPSSFSFESGNGQRSCIMSFVMAPEGFVCGFPGYMTLCGDQRGIDDEIVVQAGMLTLGFARNLRFLRSQSPARFQSPVRRRRTFQRPRPLRVLWDDGVRYTAILIR